MGTEDAIVFTTGHQAQPRRARDAAGPGRHGRRRLRRPRLDPRRLHPLAGEAARLPPQPPRQARAHPRARGGRRRRHPRRRRRRLLDGGRHRAAARDRGPGRALRRAAHGRRGAWRGRARRARRGRRASCSASRTASTCGWGPSPSRLPRAAASSRARRRSSTSCAIAEPRVPLHGRRPCPPRSARRSRRCGSAARTRGRRCFARVLDNADYLNHGLRDRGFKVVEPTTLPDGTRVVTPIVPVLVERRLEGVLLWRALYDAGVFVNVAIHPAVPPGGALLRTSVMATHDRRCSTGRWTSSHPSRRRSRPSTARCPLSASGGPSQDRRMFEASACPFLHKITTSQKARSERTIRRSFVDQD